MATKKLSRSEILRLIKEEEKKIEIAKDRKDSFQLVKESKPSKPKTRKSAVKSSSSSNKTRKTSVSSKNENVPPSIPPVYVFNKDKDNKAPIKTMPVPPKFENKVEKVSAQKEEVVASTNSNNENKVSKKGQLIFAITSIVVGLLLIAVIVIIILGISSGNFDFK